LAAGVTATPLWEEELVIAVPKRHRWADGQEVEPDDFSRTPVIRHRRPPESNAGGSAMPAGAPLFRAAPWAEISDAAAAVALARAACVPALLPAEVAYEHAGIELLVRRVRGIRLERAFGLLLRGSAAEARPDVRELATRVLALGFGEPAQTGVRRAAAG
jgi:DNA-binding transcriptional LysR family regulator